jgi:hypothetical protein
MKKTKLNVDKKNWKKILVNLEDKINLYFGEKAPQLPEKVKKVLVKICPYLILISMITSLPALLAALGVGAVIAPLALWGGVSNGLRFSWGLLFTLIIVIIQIIALPGLFKNKISSWRLMFYTTLIDAIYALITFDLLGLIVGTGLSWYFWFQIREYYKK